MYIAECKSALNSEPTFEVKSINLIKKLHSLHDYNL